MQTSEQLDNLCPKWPFWDCLGVNTRWKSVEDCSKKSPWWGGAFFCCLILTSHWLWDKWASVCLMTTLRRELGSRLHVIHCQWVAKSTEMVDGLEMRKIHYWGVLMAWTPRWMDVFCGYSREISYLTPCVDEWTSGVMRGGWIWRREPAHVLQKSPPLALYVS